MNAPFRSGFVAIAGLPNVGKSSLVNALVKESVSIVTSKPQTTRKKTLGILTEAGRYQIVFIDTPGTIDSNDGLNPYLKKEQESALKDVDVVICAIGHWEFRSKEKPWALQLGQKTKDPVYIITQSDRILRGSEAESPELLEKWKALFEGEVPPLYFTSAKTGQGLLELKNLLEERLPLGPQYYDAEIFTNQSMREVASEIVRKHCFEHLHQELPYGLAVIVQSFEEGASITKITADIVVSREAHKPMVIGQGGLNLKNIGTRSREELERLLGQKVFLKLHVVAKPGWIKDKNYIDELGFNNG